jgi:hypothetical protein
MNEELDILPVLEDPTRPKYRDVHPWLLKPAFRLAIVGASASGKSNYLMNLFRGKYYGGKDPCFNRIYCFSPNLGLDSTTRELKNMCGESNMYMHYKDSIIDGIIERQKMMDEARDKVLIIADDLIALGCSPLAKIFTSSTYLRHLDCSIIYLTQTFSGHYSIPPVVKNNLEGCVMFRCPSNKQIENFCNDLQGTFGDKDSIRAMLEDTTKKPYHFGFFDYRNLRVFHNHQKEIWRKFNEHGDYNPPYKRGDMSRNEMETDEN